MDASDGTTGPSLERRISEGARSFSFFQLVHLLESVLKPTARVGHQGPAFQEVIRFRPDTSLGFPASDISSVIRRSGSDPENPQYQITTTFMGLYGIASPLPSFYSEEILWKDEDEDATRAFLDIFHHRFISLFYRCWAKYRHEVVFDREGEDEYSGRILGLIGLGTRGVRKAGGVSPVRMMRYAGLMTQRPWSAAALEGLIGDFFEGVEVKVTQCTERWERIHQDQWVLVGKRNCRLGIDTSLGEKVRSRSGSFLVSIGPMGYLGFLQFLPEGGCHQSLCDLVRVFVKDSLVFEIEILLQSDEIPRLRLDSEEPFQLGWTTWVSSERLNGGGIRSLRFQPSPERVRA